MNGERGFTVIEVLIAVMVLTVGLLGLASTAGYVTRMIGQGDRYTEAATLASRQMETLRGVGCASMTGGSSVVGHYTVSWTITTVNGESGHSAMQMQVTVTSPTTQGPRTDKFTGMLLCS